MGGAIAVSANTLPHGGHASGDNPSPPDTRHPIGRSCDRKEAPPFSGDGAKCICVTNWSHINHARRRVQGEGVVVQVNFGPPVVAWTAKKLLGRGVPKSIYAENLTRW